MKAEIQSKAKSEIQVPDRLTIFTFMWACQAIVHQDFYSAWMDEPDYRGWALTVIAVGVLLNPRNLLMFCGMLCCSIIYNVARWPFVVNHILVESVINLTILAAVGAALIHRRTVRGVDAAVRDSIYFRFAPVIGTMLIVVYWFAFIAKLNFDFLNPDVSCVVSMYGDLLRRFPFLPNDDLSHRMAIFMTLLVEALIPLLLTFRRTRPLGVLLGIPFHVILGLVGHRTFSALAFAMYVLFCMEGIRAVLAVCSYNIQARLSRQSIRGFANVASLSAAVGIAGLVYLEVTGQSRMTIAGIISVYQISWLLWCIWSLAIGMALAGAVVWIYRRTEYGMPEASRNSRPGLVWAATLVVGLLGFSQYLGIKTETCFTMYSNLRTEGEWNNHLFMPALRLGGWQTDLVRINSTDHPELVDYVETGDLVTFFELRRIVSNTPATQSFVVDYERNGQSHYLSFDRRRISQTESWGRHPLILGKLLYFRPVPTAKCTPCRH